MVLFKPLTVVFNHLKVKFFLPFSERRYWNFFNNSLQFKAFQYINIDEAYILHVKGIKGTIVNQGFSSFNGGSLEIMLTVSLTVKYYVIVHVQYSLWLTVVTQFLFLMQLMQYKMCSNQFIVLNKTEFTNKHFVAWKLKEVPLHN